jgi:hypothetical protein
MSATGDEKEYVFTLKRAGEGQVNKKLNETKFYNGVTLLC